MDNITADNQNVDTNLAELYMKSHNSSFYSKLRDATTILTDLVLEDSFKNKIYCDNNDVIQGDKCDLLEASSDTLMQNKLKFKSYLIENHNLICQIEYLIRKIPIEETAFTINLMIQNIDNRTVKAQGDYDMTCYDGSKVKMAKSTSLLYLGFIVEMYQKVNFIVSSPDTAVIATLFTELFHKAGFTSVQLLFQPNYKIEESIKHNVQLMDLRSIGVISERSDVDSAVDTFISSTSHQPWLLKRILVQESIFDDFLKRLEWKSNLGNSVNTSNKLQVNTNIVIYYKNKIFVSEYADYPQNVDSDDHVIAIEAYRTNRELLMLLQKYQATTLSLWSSDNAEANEVALKVSARIVWINDFGNFNNGQIVDTMINSLWLNQIKHCQINIPDLKELMKTKTSWRNLSFNQRKLKIGAALCNEKQVTDCLNFDDTSVDIGDSILCIKIYEPVENILFIENPEISSITRNILIGNTVIVSDLSIVSTIIVEKMCEIGAPIEILVDDESKGSVTACVTKNVCFNVKYIFNNYGTTFAN